MCSCHLPRLTNVNYVHRAKIMQKIKIHKWTHRLEVILTVIHGVICSSLSLHAPKSSRWDRGKANLAAVWNKFWIEERFCKDICYLIWTRDMGELDHVSSYLFLHKMHIDVDVFGAIVKNKILCHTQSTDVV